MLHTTAETIPGYRIEWVLGMVVGWARLPGSLDSGAGPKLAIHRASEAAAETGANALVAVRLESVRNPSTLSFDLFAYGTAVMAEPIPAGEPCATQQSIKAAETVKTSRAA
ncbi:MAG: heavy metal-binding domain-containing protein [Bifidobacteriaceae bacterium]|jgi:uncharacterized protein YbjQ (UPF0145 family)|nr:heavy metal-binding domain-containing protein [Bifidobacteriaceae bacterium]